VPVAERTTTVGVSGNSLVWLFTDVDGTVTAQVDSVTGVVSRRFLDPFGNPIGTPPAGWSDDHGFLNKVVDADTGMQTDVRAFRISLSERAQRLEGATSRDAYAP
jgi:hypothetical protein